VRGVREMGRLRAGDRLREPAGLGVQKFRAGLGPGAAWQTWHGESGHAEAWQGKARHGSLGFDNSIREAGQWQ